MTLSRNKTLLLSHWSALRCTVISAGLPWPGKARSTGQNRWEDRNSHTAPKTGRPEAAGPASAHRRFPASWASPVNRTPQTERAPSPTTASICSPRKPTHSTTRPNALVPQIIKLSQDKRRARDLDQRLRNSFRDGAQSRRKTSRKDGHRQLHENSTFVPSKSKAKRTSSSPAAAMAWRNLLRSLA